jgi:8-oxo-dGTP pyrophosphatase MutT (NUDIX family)
MPIPRGHIETVLAVYLGRHPGERPDLLPLQDALAHTADPTSRSTYPGHITCGAVVVNPDRRVLHIRHRTLDRYLLPGGHVEQPDTNLDAAALRELHEETGLPAETVEPVHELDGTPLDIDVHQIPANLEKGEPAHWHFDFRFAFVAQSGPSILLQTAEVTEHRWFTYDRMPSVALATKLCALSGSDGATGR